MIDRNRIKSVKDETAHGKTHCVRLMGHEQITYTPAEAPRLNRLELIKELSLYIAQFAELEKMLMTEIKEPKEVPDTDSTLVGKISYMIDTRDARIHAQLLVNALGQA